MYSQHTQFFTSNAETVFTAFASLPTDYKWGDGMHYSDPTATQPSKEGDQRLILRDAETVIEEYTETLIEYDEPRTLSFSLTLDDFAMSRSAPKGKLLPNAATLSRARARIKDGRATNLILSITIIPEGHDATATLTIANAGQTAPKLGAQLFKRLTPNPAKTLLEWLASQLDAPATPSSF